MTLIEQLKSKCWKMAHEEIGNDIYENAIANKAQDILVELVIKECIDVLRQEWYNENNKVIDNENLREVNIHYGHKRGLIQAINNISQHFGVK